MQKSLYYSTLVLVWISAHPSVHSIPAFMVYVPTVQLFLYCRVLLCTITRVKYLANADSSTLIILQLLAIYWSVRVAEDLLRVWSCYSGQKWFSELWSVLIIAADPYNLIRIRIPDHKTICHRSGSRPNFDTSPDSGKNNTDPDQDKKSIQ